MRSDRPKARDYSLAHSLTTKNTQHENKIKKVQRSNEIYCNDTTCIFNTSNANKFNFVGYTANMFRIDVLCWMGVRVIFIVPNGLAVWFCKPTTPLQSNSKLSKAYKPYR